MFIVFFCSICIAFYCILIYRYQSAFDSYDNYKLNSNSPVDIYATILISCRNPEIQLEKLIAQIQFQTKSECVEIIVIDDFSDTKLLISGVNIVYLNEQKLDLNNSTNNKKQAIALGVELAKYETIICLDADIVLSEDWWLITSNFIKENNPKFAAGLHRFIQSNSLLSKCIHLEQNFLTACSIAALKLGYPTMCNGGNMIFSKSAFIAVNGYQGLYNSRGGDDLFLYHRIFKKYPEETFYIKNIEATANSMAPIDIATLIKQRVRWISKSTSYENAGIQVQSIIIYLANLVCVISIFIPKLLPLFLIKMGIEYYFLVKIKPFYQSNYSVSEYLFSMIIYPIYLHIVLIICLLKSNWVKVILALTILFYFANQFWKEHKIITLYDESNFKNEIKRAAF